MEHIQTNRLFIMPMNHMELTGLVEKYQHSVPELSMAYQEMLDMCEKYPDKYLWYTSWKMCLRDNGKEIGYAGFKGLLEDGSTEIGYGVDDFYQGRGFATEGVRALCKWALDQSGTTMIYAETEPGNEASKRVLNKIGFEPTGTVGEEGPRFLLKM